MKKYKYTGIILLVLDIILISGCIDNSGQEKTGIPTSVPVSIATVSNTATLTPVATEKPFIRIASPAEARKSLLVTGTVTKDGNVDPFGHSGEGSYYKTTIILSNKGVTPIWIDMLEGVFSAGGEPHVVYLTPGENYNLLEPGKSVDFFFTTMGKTSELLKASRDTGKRLMFGGKIYSDRTGIGLYGAPLPSAENLTRSDSTLVFTNLEE